MLICYLGSDVCYSDLIAADYPFLQVFFPFTHGKLHFRRSVDRLAVADDVDEIYRDILDPGIEAHRNPSALFKPAAVDDLAGKAVIAVIARIVGAHLPIGQQIGGARSEEHTSELQSLMRISYAVFCLKKQHKIN